MPTISEPQLVSRLIHALRTDITLYNFGETPAAQQGTINAISDMLERIDLIVQSENNELARDKVNLEAVVESVLDGLTFEQRARVKYIPLQLTVMGNKAALTSLVYELISNSLMYSDGPVIVSLHDTGSHAVFRVEDFGGGIDPAVQNRIAEPFIKTADKKSGKGLGFALAWAVAQDHEGGLTLVNEDHGTTVLFSLDLA